MNTYSPYFDSDDNCARMERDLDGSWVHVEALEATLMERDAARDAAEGLQATLKEREALLAERGRKLEEAWDRVDLLEGVIRDNLPHYYDQGEPDEDPATPEECVEYAAETITLLQKQVKRLVARLHERAQQIHAIADSALEVTDSLWMPAKVSAALREIHALTKEKL